MTNKIALAAMLLGVSADAAGEARYRWETYINVRFGYSICYPVGLIYPQQESANGDGREFISEHGAKLRVWGGYNVMEKTNEKAKVDDVARLSNEGYRINYQASHLGWYVLSGTRKAGTFYKRAMLNPEREVAFELRYPSAEAAFWDPIAARLSHCLRG